MKRLFFLITCFFSGSLAAQDEIQVINTEVLVIGGGVGGTAAALQASRLGTPTILVEPTSMLGGMLTAAAVSCTDGNDQLPSGIWEEFRQALYKHYKRNRLNTGWVSNTNFEPRVGDSILKAWAAQEKNLQVIYGYELESLQKNGGGITGAKLKKLTGNSILFIQAAVVIDATELGDVMAAAGAAYDLGMDDPKQSGEKEAREKNDIIQDLTWAAVLKDYGPEADKTIPRPANYDPKKYHCTCTDAPCEGKPWNGDKLKMLNYGKLPRSPGATRDKYMLNWPPFGNDIYLNVVEADKTTREKGYELARNHTLGFIYFMQTELGMKHIGLADDEGDKGMALIPYNREGRRLRGVVRMNINHIKSPYDYNLYRTGISVGDYPVDHHHARYPGKVPEIEFPPIPAYNIPMGALIPEKIDGLIVCEKGISVTNIVNGTTRLQPVVMLTGQAAGVLAAKTMQLKKKVREIPVRAVQEELLKAKAYLMPFSDVKPSDLAWEAIQKAGVTGILQGTGKAEGWSNKMFFYPDSSITEAELAKGLNSIEPSFPLMSYRGQHKLGISKAWDMLTELQHITRNRLKIPHKYPSVVADEWRTALKNVPGLEQADGNRLVTRRELAVMMNSLSGTGFDLPVETTGAIRK